MIVIKPNWPAPDNILAFCTTRQGGHSKGAFAGLNMAHHVGDCSEAVMRNRSRLLSMLPAKCVTQWLTQEHGCKIVEASEEAGRDKILPSADGSWTKAAGLACAVMTADCLPVLFCQRNAGVIAAAHAGWRGLSNGVLEACVTAMNVEPAQLMAWLGPAIGPAAFEVGIEVRDQFLANALPQDRMRVDQCFKAGSDRPGHYFADLYGLARIRLNAMGISDIYGGDLCTFSDTKQFYSYRRSGETGRMASIIVKTPT